MALPFLTMPDDVLAHFARQLCDATTAGRLAQTSRAGDRLMRHRLPKLQEERRQAAAQAKAAMQRAWRDAVHGCFEASEDSVQYRCIVGNIAQGTPCGTTLRVRGAGNASLQQMLSKHLQHCHLREYGALMTAFKSVHG